MNIAGDSEGSGGWGDSSLGGGAAICRPGPGQHMGQRRDCAVRFPSTGYDSTNFNEAICCLVLSCEWGGEDKEATYLKFMLLLPALGNFRA